MKKWLSGIRGTVAMILTWTVGWGLGFGGLMELLVDPAGAIIDIWPIVMAIPGFVGGALLSALLWIAEGRQSFDEVPLARYATWGGVTGLVLGVLAVSMGVVARGLGSSLPMAAAVMICITTVLGTVAAIGSAVFFRLVARRQTPTVAGHQT